MADDVKPEVPKVEAAATPAPVEAQPAVAPAADAAAATAPKVEAPAVAPAAAEPKVTHSWDAKNKRIKLENVSTKAIEDAAAEQIAAHKAVLDKLVGKNAAYDDAIKALRANVPADQLKAFDALTAAKPAMHTDFALQPLADAHLDTSYLKEVASLQAKHAPEEFKKLDTASRKYAGLVNARHNEGLSAVKTAGKIDGVAAEDFNTGLRTLKTEITTAERLNNPTFVKNHLAQFRERGALAALKKNASPETIKAHPVGFGIKVGAVGLGSVMMYDGIAHGKRKDEKGERTVDRSLLMRLGEVGGGALVVGTSALHGGR